MKQNIADLILNKGRNKMSIQEEIAKDFFRNDFNRKQIIHLDKIFYQEKESETKKRIINALAVKICSDIL